MGKKDVGRIITKALRHHPGMLGLTLDKAGYCHVNELVRQLNRYGYQADRALIERIGENERFRFNETHTKIRADYGHSLGLRLSDMYQEDSVPPEILYHGTSLDAVDSIKRDGIIRFAKLQKARDHIFLTEELSVAVKKGFRHGQSVVLPVRARELYDTGETRWYHVKNDIWLIEAAIPSRYIDFSNAVFSDSGN